MRDMNLQRPFHGDMAKALDAATTTLIPNGYRIAKRSGSEIEFEGPPLPTQPHQVSGLWGASRVVLRKAGDGLQLDIEMGHFNKQNRESLRIIAIIWFSLGGILAAIFGWQFGFTHFAVIGGLMLVFFVLMLLLSRAIGISFEKRIAYAFETLLVNAVALGENRG